MLITCGSNTAAPGVQVCREGVSTLPWMASKFPCAWQLWPLGGARLECQVEEGLWPYLVLIERQTLVSSACPGTGWTRSLYDKALRLQSSTQEPPTINVAELFFPLCPFHVREYPSTSDLKVINGPGSIGPAIYTLLVQTHSNPLLPNFYGQEIRPFNLLKLCL